MNIYISCRRHITSSLEVAPSPITAALISRLATYYPIFVIEDMDCPTKIEALSDYLNKHNIKYSEVVPCLVKPSEYIYIGSKLETRCDLEKLESFIDLVRLIIGSPRGN